MEAPSYGGPEPATPIICSVVKGANC